MSRFHDSTQVRTLHRLVLPARCHDPGETPVRRGLYIDCETSGMDWVNDDIVELGLVPFTYTDDGRVAEVLHQETQCYLNAPSRPLGVEVVARTGLSDTHLANRHIDVEATAELILRSELVIAHNARHDRPFVERAVPAARERPWACSRLEVPWITEGFTSAALDSLAYQFGVFPAGSHRALADCETALWLLAQRLPRSGRPVLGALLERALVPSCCFADCLRMDFPDCLA